jgi:hypothetical protein
MTMKPWSRRDDRHVEEEVEFDFPMDELLPAPAPTITTMQADCCIAAAAYLIVLPATPGRPHATELMLCGHHFRTSRDALRKANATAFDGHTKKLCAIAD